MNKWVSIISLLIGLGCLVSAAFFFLQIPIIKMHTPMAIDSINKDFIDRSELSAEERDNLDFYIRWIKGNDVSLKQQHGPMRRIGVYFSVFMAAFCFVISFYVWKSNNRLKHITQKSRVS